MAADVRIRLLTEIDQSLKQIKKFQKQTSKDFKRVRKDAVGLSGSLKRVGEQFTALVGKDLLFRGLRRVSDGFKGAIGDAVELENALTGLRAVARATGEDIGGIEQIAKDLASDGLIPLADVAATLKNLLATGVGADIAVKTFKALRNAAAFNRQGQLSLGEAIKGASQGIKNQLSSLVDNAGITKNLSILNKEYARSIDKTVGKLTDQEKALGSALGVIKEGIIFQGNYTVLLGTFSGALSEVAGQSNFLSSELGEIITKSDLGIKSVRLFARFLKELKIAVKDNKKEIRAYLRDGVLLLIKGLNLAFFIIKEITDSVVKQSLAIRGLIISYKKFSLEGRKLVIANRRGGQSAAGAAKEFKDLQEQTDENDRSFLQLSRDIDAFDTPGIGDDINAAMNDLIFSLENTKEEAKDVKEALDGLDIPKPNSDLKNALKDVKKETNELANTLKTVFAALRGAKPIKVELEAVVQGPKESDEDFEERRQEAQLKFERSLAEERERQLKNAGNLLGEGISKAFGEEFGELFKFLNQPAEDIRAEIEALVQSIPEVIQRVVENIGPLLTAILKGAVDLIGGLLEALPEIVQGLFDGLDEFLDFLLDEFPDQLLAVIENIDEVFEKLVDKIPVIIEKLAEKIPLVIAKFIELLPQIVVKLAGSMVKVAIKLAASMPKVAISLIKGLIKGLPEFISSMARGLFEAIKDIFGGIGGEGIAGTGILGSEGILGIEGIPFLKHGGQVPEGFDNDRFLARLSSGENVIDRSLNQKLAAFLDNPNGQNQAVAASPRPIVINIGSKTIIDEINDEIEGGRVLEAG